MRFSIIVVCLNAGEKLYSTLDSILKQTNKDYEVVIKDGLSTDDSVSKLQSKLLDGTLGELIPSSKDSSQDELKERIHIYSEKDKSIYDAMNQAVRYAKGDYYIFLNCGDLFASERVLEDMAKAMDKEADIYYGDMIRSGCDQVIASYPEITDFVCYRNIPCHQVCFYNKKMFEERGYDLSFPIRADYEHFLWCKYEKKASFAYTGTVVCIYEGNGFSETKDNEKAALLEHKTITNRYLGKKCILYKFIMIITLQKLRKKMAESKAWAGLYQKLKGFIYGKRKA